MAQQLSHLVVARVDAAGEGGDAFECGMDLGGGVAHGGGQGVQCFNEFGVVELADVVPEVL